MKFICQKIHNIFNIHKEPEINIGYKLLNQLYKNSYDGYYKYSEPYWSEIDELNFKYYVLNLITYEEYSLKKTELENKIREYSDMKYIITI